LNLEPVENYVSRVTYSNCARKISGVQVSFPDDRIQFAIWNYCGKNCASGSKFAATMWDFKSNWDNLVPVFGTPWRFVPVRIGRNFRSQACPGISSPDSRKAFRDLRVVRTPEVNLRYLCTGENCLPNFL